MEDIELCQESLSQADIEYLDNISAKNYLDGMKQLLLIVTIMHPQKSV